MKKIIAITIFILIAFFVGYEVYLHVFSSTASLSAGDIKNYPPHGKKIVAFGDSLIYGVGASPGKDFVSDVSDAIHIPIENDGVSGETSTNGLSRIDTMLESKPDIVILLLGGNDAIQRVDPDTTFKNIGTIIEKIENSGAIVVLLGVQGGLFNDPYASRFEALSKEYKTAYVSNIESGLIGHDEFMSDTVHPNDVGYAHIAERVEPVLAKLLP